MSEAYMNESSVGTGIKLANIPRDKLYVTTKVVGTKDQDVDGALATSLNNLALDYVDLYMVHVPFAAGSPEGLQDIWMKMELVKKSGKARSIGVCNFKQEDLEIVLQKATIIPAVNQIEFHPYQQHDESLFEFHRQHDIIIAAYSPLAAITTARPGPIDGIHADLAKKYNVSESEIALRWVIDQKAIAVTTSKSVERLRGYSTKLFSFYLTENEVKQITELGKGKSYQGPTISKFPSLLFLLYKASNK